MFVLNLISRPAYIAGVTNPIFETSRAWDLLLDISTGHVIVAKDIHATYPTAVSQVAPPLIILSGTIKAESSLGNEDDLVKGGGKDKTDYVPKADNNADTLFIEDVSRQMPALVLMFGADCLSQIKAAIEYHYGESLVRVRFIEYVTRFVRLAARYEEEALGVTSISYPSSPFCESNGGRSAQLGSGIVFNDETLGMRELGANAPRVDAWRKTNSYHYYVQVNFPASYLVLFIFIYSPFLFSLLGFQESYDGKPDQRFRRIASNISTPSREEDG